jgi:ABC-2 type transport system permease protein
MSLLAWVFYSFNIFVVGISLVPFVLNLVALGWAIGIFTTALILRFGQQAEILAWGIAILFQPVSAVFYPVAVLPPVLRWLARYVPSSYVFEGMREVVASGRLPVAKLFWATGLNAVYLAVVTVFFYAIFRSVKKKGLLARIGE